MTEANQTIIAYTDGGCRGNNQKGKPRTAAWGVVIFDGTKHVIQSGGEVSTKVTNNQMELMAAIHALTYSAQTGRSIHITTDSTYVYDGFTKYRVNRLNGRGKQDYKNKDLWAIAYDLYQELQTIVTFELVLGHNGNTGNELADTCVNLQMDLLSVQ